MKPSDAVQVIGEPDLIMMYGVQRNTAFLSVNSPGGSIDVGSAKLQRALKKVPGVSDTSYRYSRGVGTLRIELESKEGKYLRFGDKALSMLTATIHGVLREAKK